MLDALLVEFVEAEEVVESSGISTTSQVWRVASGAKETRRLAAKVSRCPIGIDSWPVKATVDRGKMFLT